MTTANTMPQTTPRSLEVLIHHVRAETHCPRCGAVRGRSCEWQGHRGLHLARFSRAYLRRKMTDDEMVMVFGSAVAFTNVTIVWNGAR